MRIIMLALAAQASGQTITTQSQPSTPAQATTQLAPTPITQPAPQTVAEPVAPQAGPVVRLLPAGTMVTLTPLEEINSKHMKEGQRFQFMVVSDVTEKGVVVIPRGSPAVGLVTMQTGRAVGGKSGKFDVTFESVTANGVTFPLSGIHRQEGKGNTLGALFGSLIISGHSAVMLPGEVANAFVKEATAY